MEQVINEFDLAMRHCSEISHDLNEAIEEYNEVQLQITDLSSKTFMPFGLENRDSDPALEGLMEKTGNLLRKIGNFIVKLWTNIKELLDKAFHMFSTTASTLKKYQAVFKTGGKKVDDNKFNTRVVCYSKTVMIKRVEAILNEINMRWTEADGSPNMAERKSLEPIGFKIRIPEAGRITASYNGAFPREDTIYGHGYQLADIAMLVDNAVTMFDQFPNYKKGITDRFDTVIKNRYATANSDTQKKAVILYDRSCYMAMHKTLQFVLKSIREIGKQAVTMCKALEI